MTFAIPRLLKNKHCAESFKNKQGLAAAVHMKCKNGVVERIIAAEVRKQEQPVPAKTKVTVQQSLASAPRSLKQSVPIRIEDGEPRPKRKSIAEDAKFKAEVIDSKEGSLLAKEVIEIYKSFQTDTTKVSKWLKNKVEFVKAAANMEKNK